MDPHQHAYVPVITMRGSKVLGWEAQLTLDPTYPFQCRKCAGVLWLHMAQAEELGLVKLNFLDSSLPAG